MFDNGILYTLFGDQVDGLFMVAFEMGQAEQLPGYDALDWVDTERLERVIIPTKWLRKVCNSALHAAGGHSGLVTALHKDRKVWDQHAALNDEGLAALAEWLHVEPRQECEPLPYVEPEFLQQVWLFLDCADALTMREFGDFRSAIITRMAQYAPKICEEIRHELDGSAAAAVRAAEEKRWTKPKGKATAAA